MKKTKTILSILCALVLGMTVLCSCGGTKPESGESQNTEKTDNYDGQFRVGYGRTDIMPDEYVPLDSYGNADKRISTGYLNKIYFSAIAVTDPNNKTLLLMSYDITQCVPEVIDNLRDYAMNTYGIEAEYVHLSGTHTHSSVALTLNSDVVSRYKTKLFARAHEAIDQAMADRKPAEMYIAETKTENLNFVRHYYRADGTTTGDNHGNWSTAEVVKHTKDPDETMRVIKFTRGEEKDVVLVNWQAHNHLTGGSTLTNLAADFSGAMRESMEKKQNCLVTFFQGCAGNLNEKDNRLPENTRTEDYREFGELLAGYVNDVYDKMEKAETGEVKAHTESFKLNVNHSKDALYSQASAIYNEWKVSNNTSAGTKAGEPYGIHSVYMAEAIVRNFGLPETVDMFANVYSIGEIGWSSVPVEMFDTTGENIRKASPFKFTFTQGYTDSSLGYLPTLEAYEYGCYEADTTRFEPGSAEKVEAKIIEMLKNLK